VQQLNNPDHSSQADKQQRERTEEDSVEMIQAVESSRDREQKRIMELR
jgi:hypothetical protein